MHMTAENKDHKADQDGKNPQRIVEERHVLTCTKHDSALAMHQLTAN